jgi:hypothetical protein
MRQGSRECDSLPRFAFLAALGYALLKGETMPTLEWIGKDKVVNHHLDVPCRVLEHRYSYRGNGETGPEIPDGNKIIRGDNLEALKAFLPQYEGRIKCIWGTFKNSNCFVTGFSAGNL